MIYYTLSKNQFLLGTWTNSVSDIINLLTRRKLQKFIHVSTGKMETQIVYFKAENDYKIKLRLSVEETGVPG